MGISKTDRSQQHRKVHADRDISCAACYRSFGSVSAAVIHQESNNCDSGMTMTFIKQLARVCNRERDGSYLSAEDSDHLYRCPECGMAFRLMSGLLQHAESRACGTDVQNGPLTKFCMVVARCDRWTQP
jgi:hypothetical protein